MDILFSFLIGLALLLAGGHGVVHGSVRVARELGLSEFLIGVVLIGFGTSSPELITSVQAAWNGSAGLAFGNVVGSNTTNILCILGATAALFPVVVEDRTRRIDVPVLLGLTALYVLAMLLFPLSRVVAFFFILVLVGYIYLTHRNERGGVVSGSPVSSVPINAQQLLLNGAIAIAGIAALVFGAGMLVDASSELARGVGISETVIGLTIVALGTSLPELVSSVGAAWKGKAGLAMGNIIGSNIYNLFGILGITGLIAPTEVPSDVAYLHGPLMLLVTAAFYLIVLRHQMIARRTGQYLVLGYVGYLVFLGVLSMMF